MSNRLCSKVIAATGTSYCRRLPTTAALTSATDASRYSLPSLRAAPDTDAAVAPCATKGNSAPSRACNIAAEEINKACSVSHSLRTVPMHAHLHAPW
jgi:hypothetical protein